MAVNKFSFKIRTLTPIWTGGPDGKPNGLKMSGVIGGMRQAFEMLVRKHGGHTCNITGEADQRCLRDNETSSLCPACRIFGCTGLGRVFRMDFELPMVGAVIPQEDSYKPNRNHTPPAGIAYGQPTKVDTWLATTVDRGATVGDHNAAQAILASLKPAFSDEVCDLKIVQLRPQNIPSEDMKSLLTYLLYFMSRYTGIGAKTHLGWGQFDVFDETGNELAPTCLEAGARVIAALPSVAGPHHDCSLPNAVDCFGAEWQITAGANSPALGFGWPADVYGFRCAGYGLRYRLRRHLKFLEVDGAGTLPVAEPWRTVNHGRPWSYAPGMPWEESIAFTRALFGRDMAGNDDKHAGLIGVSHAYKRNGHWHVKLFGRLPDGHYNYIPSGGGPVLTLPWDHAAVNSFLVNEFSQLIGTSPVCTY